ncbi:hypothetical protein NLG97_g7749 [Lecanicillium saksenae]|uniref:Uncharacterized protein n=1 Tax=Lecanicillium saksenae TaxID=468837 RepID=A0ACC1QM72_9HYPO|nr:hypothetical protein NLG97_g7749 [Lecanicillium saksenae]
MQLSFSLGLSFMASTAFGAAISVREDNPVPANYCCFHLQDTISGKHVQQDTNTGELFLHDPSLKEGWYCINQNSGSKILYDRDYNACILTSPNNSFECLDGTPGGDTWAIGPYVSGTVLLQDYGSIEFNICNVKGRQQIYGANPPSGLSCQKTQLNTDNRTGQCKW